MTAASDDARCGLTRTRPTQLHLTYCSICALAAVTVATSVSKNLSWRVARDREQVQFTSSNWTKS
ncbi:hypothetical protein J6590_057261 [Homalodisca vitripennis]|nr:hypothetical protein J6590_057261 [Homalodisca vitripennis]